MLEIGTYNVGTDGFGGITSGTLIRSATFTCDFNFDLTCGAYDVQFGKFAAGAVPEPSAWALMIIGLGMIGGTMRRRNLGKMITNCA